MNVIKFESFPFQKQSIFDKTQKSKNSKKVKKSESFIAETTLTTDCPLSTGHDKVNQFRCYI